MFDIGIGLVNYGFRDYSTQQMRFTIFAQAQTGTVTSAYGQRTPVKYIDSSGKPKKTEDFHNGLDIAAPTGTPVNATELGQVTIVTPNDLTFGNRVEITYPDESKSISNHLDNIDVSNGQILDQGDTLGGMGSTGASTGPHDHQEYFDPQGNEQYPAAQYGARPGGISLDPSVQEDPNTGKLCNK